MNWLSDKKMLAAGLALVGVLAPALPVLGAGPLGTIAARSYGPATAGEIIGRSSGKAPLVVAEPAVDPVRLARVDRFASQIERYSRQYGVDEALVRALIYTVVTRFGNDCTICVLLSFSSTFMRNKVALALLC